MLFKFPYSIKIVILALSKNPMAKNQEKYTKRRLRSSYFTTFVSTTLVLFMLGVLGLVIFHAKKLSDHVKENIGIRVMIKEDVREADIIQLQKTLDVTEYIKSTEYITPERAARELQAELGEEFIDFLGYNPLPPSIDLRLNAEFTTIDQINRIEAELLANKSVKEIFYQKSLVHAINQNLKKIGLILLGFSAVLLFISIALINNTIRLSVYSQRFIIRSMSLVGATQSFIRKPFILKGISQGLYSAFIAIIFLCGIIYFAQQELPELIEIQDFEIFASLFGVVILCGVIISSASTFFAIRKYLKMKTDDLYY